MKPLPDTSRCLFPLRTEEALREYELIARTLLSAGRLTIENQRALSSYAMQFDLIIKAANKGDAIRASRFTQLDRVRAKLKLHELEKPMRTDTAPHPNKFANCGFASRRETQLLAEAAEPYRPGSRQASA